MNKCPTFIAHRVNELNTLQKLTRNDIGCEIDLRSDMRNPGSLILTHDPWKNGDDFNTWLECYARRKFKGPLILNTKEDGLEEAILKKLIQYNITNYFFLDTTVPTTVKWTTQHKNKNFAVRMSSFEPLEYVLRFKGLLDWIWIDCFHMKPLDYIQDLKEKTGFKVCLVSPELQGGNEQDFPSFKEWALHADAVCTKKIEDWEKVLK